MDSHSKHSIILSWIGTLIANIGAWMAHDLIPIVQQAAIVGGFISAVLTAGYTLDKWLYWRKNRDKANNKTEE